MQDDREQHATPDPSSAAIDLTSDLDAVDAQLLERDGPDAVTNRRFVRQIALEAEFEPTLVASAFGAFRKARDWTPLQLASWLNLNPDQFAHLALEHRPESGDLEGLVRRYGVDPIRLARVLDE